MHLVLFEPDIPQNAGAAMRLAACLGVALDIVEPCGFLLDDRRLRRVVMDYAEGLDWARHASWDAFLGTIGDARMVLLTTGAHQSYADFPFARGDRLIVGRESGGVPQAVHAAAHARIRVPMRPGARSLNVVVASAIVLGEALRQTGGLPPGTE